MTLTHETCLSALAHDRRAFARAAGLADAPRLFRAALRQMARNWGVGSVTFVTPHGRELHLRGEAPGPEARLLIRDFNFMRRVLSGGVVGFAEGYMAGEWETPHLSPLLEVMALNFERLERVTRGNPLVRGIDRLRHALLRRNTRRGARKNIHAHYDLGNAFYARWLDPTMSYSSAVYEYPEQPLSEAQTAKYLSLAQSMALAPGQHVLEIGCGWGGFAEFAAKEIGAKVTAITISRAQYDYAAKRMFDMGLADRAEVRLVDYRDVDGQFDRIASIEMFEAVGEKYWPAYFDKVAHALKPGGRAGLQIITIQDELFDGYRKHADFIQKYIFPGGLLPSLERLKTETQRAGLAWTGVKPFGLDYAATLAEWARRFEDAWDDIKPLGFDERFRRLWRFYLSYCEAGFRTGRTDVVQLGLAKA